IVPALVQALEDQDPQVRLSAGRALSTVGADDPRAREVAAALIRKLTDHDARVRAAAAGLLATLKPDPALAIPALLAAARSDTGSPTSPVPSRASAGAITAAESIVQSQRDHARASAVNALGAIGTHDPEAQRALVDLAGDPVPEVRMVVART